jgi:CheY-like chemotaxis protein
MARDHAPGGVGIGLSLAHRLVEMHGGTVQAESEGEGQGSTFTIRLPFVSVRPAKSPKRAHPIAEVGTPLAGLQSLGGVHVLAVDDEADSRGLLRVVLEAAGATVTTAASAAEALGLLETAPPDALVADIGMPEMDGFELIKHVRTLPNQAAAQVPAAALTAFARSEDRTKALQSGFEMHLAKPVDPGELVASVATLVRRHRVSKHMKT